MSSKRAWWRAVERLAAEFGCTVTKTQGSHLRLQHPDGWRVICSSSPSGDERRGLRNVRAELRRRHAGSRNGA